MPRDIAKSNRAIAEAWRREKELVKKGMGTRDWSPDQQRDILATGKVHDADGKAFEGHHMKCVSKYPDFQGEPKNIQFLSRDEHIKAHNGKTQNPTNGYYDYKIEKTTVIFDEDTLIPITPMPLTKMSDEVKTIIAETESTISDTSDAEREDKQPPSNVKQESSKAPQEQTPKESSNAPGDAAISEEHDEDYSDLLPDYTSMRDFKIPNLPRYHYEATPEREEKKGVFQRISDWKEDFQYNHPIASALIEGSFQLGGQLLTQWAGYQMSAVEDEMDRISEKKTRDNSVEWPSISAPESTEAPAISTEVSAITHSSPSEQEVGQHRQRYHTKRGIEWREKDPYKRGGNKVKD